MTDTDRRLAPASPARGASHAAGRPTRTPGSRSGTTRSTGPTAARASTASSISPTGPSAWSSSTTTIACSSSASSATPSTATRGRSPRAASPTARPPSTGARRELREETGVEAGDAGATSRALRTCRTRSPTRRACSTWRPDLTDGEAAPGADRGARDSGWVPFAEAMAMIDRGEIARRHESSWRSSGSPGCGRAERPAPGRDVTELHVLRVFVGARRPGRQPARRLPRRRRDPGGASPGRRRRLGFSETVFVDDSGRGRIRIFTPGAELPSPATRPSGRPGCWPRPARVDTLRPPAGEVRVRHDDGRVGPGRPGLDPSDHARRARRRRPRSRRSRRRRLGETGTTLGLARSRPRATIREPLLRRRATGSPRTRRPAPRPSLIADRLGQGLEIHQGRGSRLSTRLGPTARSTSGAGSSSTRSAPTAEPAQSEPIVRRKKSTRRCSYSAGRSTIALAWREPSTIQASTRAPAATPASTSWSA